MTLKFGDKEFDTFALGTAEHDNWVRARTYRAGLHNLEINRGEAYEEFAERILLELCAAEVTFDLIASWLVPVGKTGKDWTPALARETAAYLRSLTDPDDKRRIDDMILTLLIDFFAKGTRSIFVSRNTSGARPEKAGEETAGSLMSLERGAA